MNPKRFFVAILLTAALACTTFIPLPANASDKKLLQFSDIMQFREHRNLTLSRNGEWIAYTSRPDRGISTVIAIHSKDGTQSTLDGHEEPTLSADGSWMFAYRSQDPNKYDNPQEKKTEGRSLTLTRLKTDQKEQFEHVSGAAFDFSGKWLFIRTRPPESEKTESHKNPADKSSISKGSDKEERGLILLINLKTGNKTEYQAIVAAAMDPDGPHLAMVGTGRLTLLDLSGPIPSARILCDLPEQVFGQPVWSEKKSRLAVTVSLGKKSEKEQKPEQTVHIWQPGHERTKEVPRQTLPSGWIIPPKSPLKWDQNGQRLSIGTRPLDEYLFYHPLPVSRPEGSMSTSAPFKELLAERTVEVWHWNDERIKSQEKAQQKKTAERTYTAVYTPGTRQMLQLGGIDMQKVILIDDCPFALGFNNRPYSQETTWDGYYDDIYLIDLRTGMQELVIKRTQQPASLSPGGKYVAYFREGHWYLYSSKTRRHRNITASLIHSFADEDHDTPDEPQPYGIIGWLEGDGALFFYDRYDIWRHDTASNQTSCITSGLGRQEKIQFRRIKTDKRENGISAKKDWLLTAFSEKEKWTRFYQGQAAPHVPRKLSDGDYSYRFLLEGENQNTILFSRERLEVFPDIWVTDRSFSTPRQISSLNPQIDSFNWGRAELMKWKSIDGIDLEGVVIKPENYQPGKKYPVIVYYYELSADRLLRYNQTVINHRPCFPFYASNGYVLFLPDIRFQQGRPGQSAVECLVPGVLKLIDCGLADPKAIGLHGHSWSGYQTAFVVTQTDLFACALAGAPVANMTSAYSGIRWGEGIARQFQYEKSQSRIGKSLFEAPQLYIENSPVFFAQRINTPLLIEHGDEDEAVPWYQSIELYLAMRRLQKPCVFLQYNSEPHHLKQYANKLDYSIKMKAFFDHFLKGAPAPDWWRHGSRTPIKAPYRTEKNK